MNEQLKSNLLSKKHWVRLLYMVFFAALFYVAFLVIWVAVAVQFLFALITGSDNDNVRTFGSSLSQFVFQITQFLTYNSDVKPFPLADWPEPVERVKDEVEHKDEVEEASTVADSSDEASLTDKAPGEVEQNSDCDVSGETSLDTEDESKGDIKPSDEHESSIETVDSLLDTDDPADETSADETSAEPQAVEEELSEELSEQEKGYISEEVEVEDELEQTSSVTSSADDSEEKPFSKNR